MKSHKEFISLEDTNKTETSSMVNDERTDTNKKLICLSSKMKTVNLRDDGDTMKKGIIKYTIEEMAGEYYHGRDVDENISDAVQELSSKMKRTSLVHRQDSVLDYLRVRRKVRKMKKKKRNNMTKGLILAVYC